MQDAPSPAPVPEAGAPHAAHRLAWLPRRRGRDDGLVLTIAAGVVAGAVVAQASARLSLSERMIVLGLAAVAAVILAGTLRARARESRHSYLERDPALGLLRIRSTAMGIAFDIPLAQIAAVTVAHEAAGDRVMILRDGAPQVMASGLLEHGDAQAQGMRLSALIGCPFRQAAAQTEEVEVVRGSSISVDRIQPGGTDDPTAAIRTMATERPMRLRSVLAWSGVAAGLALMVAAAIMQAGAAVLLALGAGGLLLGLFLWRAVPDQPVQLYPPRVIDIDAAGRRLRARGGPIAMQDTGWIPFAAIQHIVGVMAPDGRDTAIHLLLFDRPLVALTRHLDEQDARRLSAELAAIIGCEVQRR